VGVLLVDSPAAKCHVPTFRKTGPQSLDSLFRNVGTTYEDGTVFRKHRHIKFRRQGITQKKE